MSLRHIWQETWGWKGSSECGEEASEVGFQFSESPQPAACTTHCISWPWVVEDHQ
jgi:hypothetical protein